MPVQIPFDPKNAPALFQRMMDEVLRELQAVARAFINATIVHTKGFQAHLAALRAVFEKLTVQNQGTPQEDSHPLPGGRVLRAYGEHHRP
jgi:hypothetical protein